MKNGMHQSILRKTNKFGGKLIAFVKVVQLILLRRYCGSCFSLPELKTSLKSEFLQEKSVI